MTAFYNVALTGGFGSGKTTALNIFHSLGCLTYNIDVLCDDLYNDDDQISCSVRNKIINFFGNDVVDCNNINYIDKQKLSKIVFSDYYKLQKLSDIIHPVLKLKIFKIKQLHMNSVNILIFEIPLLFESYMAELFDIVISVWTSPKLIVDRLLNKGFNYQQIKSRINFQIYNDKKLELADYGLINNWNYAILKEQCLTLYNKILYL